MIVLYAEKEDMGIKYAAALGGIQYNGILVDTQKLPTYQSGIKRELADKDGYLKTKYMGKDYIVTWGSGHFGTLKDIRDYNPELKYWNQIPMPFFPKKFEVKLIESKNKRQFGIVSKLFNSSSCEYIINGTDWEREGELIFAYTYNLTGTDKPYKRLRSNAKTQNQIRKDFAALVSMDENTPNVLAARGRGIADWVVGINMTIAATLYLSPDNKLINVGRVLTPTLTLIVNREKEIRDFVPKTTYGVNATFTLPDDETYQGKLELEEPFEKVEQASDLIATLEDDGVIKTVEKKKEVKKPPLLHNTQTLQVEANEIYGYTLERTLNIAQKLYENGYTTYPRVDSQYLTEDKIPEMPGLLRLLEGYSEYEGKGMFESYDMPKRYFNNSKVDGHDAIITTEVIPTELSEEEANIYDLIARRMIMAVAKDAVAEKTTVFTEVNSSEGEKALFKTTGSIYLERGFLKYMLGKKESDNALPASIREGVDVDADYEVSEQTSKPPARYTDATLIKAMENCGRKIDDEVAKEYLKKSKGIGRPATRAALMERLVRAEFVERRRKQIFPTEKGMRTVDAITIDDLKSPILTADWESRLDEIEQANKEESRKLLISFIRDVENKTGEWCNDMKKNQVEKTVTSPGDTGISCPICGKAIIEGKAKDGKPANYYCSGYKDGCKFSVRKSINGKTITKTNLKDLIEKGRTREIKGFVSNKGKEFSAYLVLVDAYVCDECGAVQQPGETCWKSDCNGALSPDPSGRKLVVFEFPQRKQRR